MSRKPRILLVGAGAGFSTKDVELGFYEGLQELDVDLSFYLLDKRIGVASQWLKYQWRKLFNSDPKRKPTWADAVYRGGIEALEMALRFDVDLVLFISAMYIHGDILVMMRRAGLKTAVMFTESPYQDDQQAIFADLVDIVFTNERTSVPFLQTKNPHTYYIRHSYSPQRHQPGDGDLNGHDVVFVGTGFQERIDLLEAVDWKDINLGLYGNWALLPPRHKLRKFVKGGILTNEGTHRLYKASKIGLNLYRTSTEYKRVTNHVMTAESLNPRAYELAAAGVFTLTEYRKEGWETFGTSQVPFLSADELSIAIRHYLKDEESREVHVKNALQKVKEHIFVERVKDVLEHAIS